MRHELIELHRAPAARADEVTLYVKGFLARGEEPDHFGAWLESHRALERSHGWAPHAVACRWPSGEWMTRPLAALGTLKGAVDVVRIVRNVRRAARVAHWGAFVAARDWYLTALTRSPAAKWQRPKVSR